MRNPLSNVDTRPLRSAARAALNLVILVAVAGVGLYAYAGWQASAAIRNRADAPAATRDTGVDPAGAFAARCAVEAFTVTDRVNAPTEACAAAERTAVSDTPMTVQYAAPLTVGPDQAGTRDVVVHLLVTAGDAARWLCADLPVHTDGVGYALAAPPTLTACPPVAEPPARADRPVGDRTATADATPTLEAFMDAFVEGRREVTNAMSTVDPEPLDAGLEYIRLDDVRVAALDTEGQHVAYVAARVWLPDSTAEFTIRYRIGLTVTPDGWVITSVS